VALGVAGGYFLGRTKKMKLALMLGGMMAGRRTGGPGELLAQGGKLMSRSPELTKLVEDVRGQLFEAGKGAALAVATRQVESLADRVGGQPVSRVKDAVAETDDGDGDGDGDGEERPDRAGERATSRAGGAASRARSAGTGAGTRARRAGSARGSGRASTAARSTRTARRREDNDD
jgi:hypothetical protein